MQKFFKFILHVKDVDNIYYCTKNQVRWLCVEKVLPPKIRMENNPKNLYTFGAIKDQTQLFFKSTKSTWH